MEQRLNKFLLFLVVVFILSLVGIVNHNRTKKFLNINVPVFEKDKPFSERNLNPDPPLISSDKKFQYSWSDFAVNILKPGTEISLNRNVFIDNGSPRELDNEPEDGFSKHFSRCYISLVEFNSGVLKDGTKIKVNRIIDAPKSPKNIIRENAFAFYGTTDNGTMLKIEIVSVIRIQAVEGEYTPTMKDVKAFFDISFIKGPKEL